MSPNEQGDYTFILNVLTLIKKGGYKKRAISYLNAQRAFIILGTKFLSEHCPFCTFITWFRI